MNQFRLRRVDGHAYGGELALDVIEGIAERISGVGGIRPDGEEAEVVDVGPLVGYNKRGERKHPSIINNDSRGEFGIRTHRQRTEGVSRPGNSPSFHRLQNSEATDCRNVVNFGRDMRVDPRRVVGMIAAFLITNHNVVPSALPAAFSSPLSFSMFANYITPSQLPASTHRLCVMRATYPFKMVRT